MVDRMITVDPGKTTGWCLWRETEIIPYPFGILKPRRQGKKKFTLSERCHDLADQFHAILILYMPNLVVLEMPEIWMGSAKSYACANRGDLFILTYLVGCYGRTANMHAIEVQLITPSMWKGQLSKGAVDAFIKRKTGQTYPNHISDAVGMGFHVRGEL